MAGQDLDQTKGNLRKDSSFLKTRLLSAERFYGVQLVWQHGTAPGFFLEAGAL